MLEGFIIPAMMASWALGLWIVYDGGWISAHWLHLKLLLVVALSAVHGMLARWTNDFAADCNRHSERFYRIVNEVPAVLMVVIVIIAVVTPFCLSEGALRRTVSLSPGRHSLYCLHI